MKRYIKIFLISLICLLFGGRVQALAQGNNEASEAITNFSDVSTKSSIKMSYEVETHNIVALSLRFGGIIPKEVYDENSRYGVIVVSDKDEALLDTIKSAKDEVIQKYAVEMIPVRVDENGRASDVGDYYQFAWVIPNMEGNYDFNFVSAMYKEDESGLTLAGRKHASVLTTVKTYVDTLDKEVYKDPLMVFDKILNENTHTINYIGANLPQSNVRHGEALAKPADPTKPGYNFIGWYLNGEAYDFSKPVENSFTLEAKWEATDYIYNLELKDNNLIITGNVNSKYYGNNISIDFEAEGVELPKRAINNDGVIKYTPKYKLKQSGKIADDGSFKLIFDLNEAVFNYNLYAHITISDDSNNILFGGNNEDITIDRCQSELFENTLPENVKLAKCIYLETNGLKQYVGDLYGRLGLYALNSKVNVECTEIKLRQDGENIYYDLIGSYEGYTKNTLELFFDAQIMGSLHNGNWGYLIDRQLIESIDARADKTFTATLNITELLTAKLTESNQDILNILIHFGSDVKYGDAKTSVFNSDEIELNNVIYKLISNENTFNLVTLSMAKKQKQKYTVKFIDDDGTLRDTFIVEEGSTLTKPKYSDKDKDRLYFKKFMGFDKEIPNAITSDLELRLVYKDCAKDYVYSVEFKNDKLIISGIANPIYNNMNLVIDWEFVNAKVQPKDTCVIKDEAFLIEVNLLELNLNYNGFAHITIMDNEGNVKFGGAKQDGGKTDLLIDRCLTVFNEKTITGTVINHSIECEASNTATYYAGYAWGGLMLYGVNYNKDFKVTSVDLTNEADNIIYTINGSYSGYTKDELLLNYNIQHNANLDHVNWGILVEENAPIVIDEFNNKFIIKINISEKLENIFFNDSEHNMWELLIHLGFNGNEDIKGLAIAEKTINLRGFSYTLHQNVDTFDTPSITLIKLRRTATIANVDGRAIVTITGLTHRNFDFFKTLVCEYNEFYNNGVWEGDWAKHDVASTFNLDNKFMTMTMDITDLLGNEKGIGYTTKLRTTDLNVKDPTDVKIEENIDSSITIGNKTYQIVGTPNSGDPNQFWGCLGVIVKEVA